MINDEVKRVVREHLMERQDQEHSSIIKHWLRFLHSAKQPIQIKSLHFEQVASESYQVKLIRYTIFRSARCTTDQNESYNFTFEWNKSRNLVATDDGNYIAPRNLRFFFRMYISVGLNQSYVLFFAKLKFCFVYWRSTTAIEANE